MDLLDLLKLRVSDAPWYTKWWWWALAAVIGLAVLFGKVAYDRSARQEREKNYRIIKETTRVIVDNEHTVEEAKEVLHEVEENRARIAVLDELLEEEISQSSEMRVRIDGATTLEELRVLREEMVHGP